jgi:lysyl-tRNA synthetase class I
VVRQRVLSVLLMPRHHTRARAAGSSHSAAAPYATKQSMRTDHGVSNGFAKFLSQTSIGKKKSTNSGRRLERYQRELDRDLVESLDRRLDKVLYYQLTRPSHGLSSIERRQQKAEEQQRKRHEAADRLAQDVNTVTDQLTQMLGSDMTKPNTQKSGIFTQEIKTDQLTQELDTMTNQLTQMLTSEKSSSNAQKSGVFSEPQSVFTQQVFKTTEQLAKTTLHAS